MFHRVAIGSLLLCGMAAAQSSHGYVFVAPGAASAQGFSETTVQGGGGFEALVFKRWVGVGAEAGYLTRTNDWGGGIGVASPNAYFHVPGDRYRKVDPFATVGYSLLFRSGTRNAVNYGGGINWWFSDGAGLKFEIRDQYASPVHYWGIRFGIAFR